MWDETSEQSDEPICRDTAFASRVPLKREFPAQLLQPEVFRLLQMGRKKKKPYSRIALAI
ncbi:hypothetical protein EBQ91_06655 [bacterium]|nr:hypothetical protein [bacterium]